MSVVPIYPGPPPWVNRHLPRALLRHTRGGHSAARAGPSYRLRGRAASRLTSRHNTEMTNFTQRRSHATLVAIDRNGWFTMRRNKGSPSSVRPNRCRYYQCNSILDHDHHSIVPHAGDAQRRLRSGADRIVDRGSGVIDARSATRIGRSRW